MKNNRQKISQDEVQLAIQKFLKHGGLIVKLPDQAVRQRKTIGEDKYQIYEALSNLPTIG
jgi:hypothetical protein